MKKEAIYIYGKTMESIMERYSICKQALSDCADVLVYIDIQVKSGYRPSLQKLKYDVNANCISAIYIANSQTISRDNQELQKFRQYVESRTAKLIDVSLLRNSIEELLPTMSKAIDEWEDMYKKKEVI